MQKKSRLVCNQQPRRKRTSIVVLYLSQGTCPLFRPKGRGMYPSHTINKSAILPCMELEIVRSDPAGNITIFVVTPLGNAERVAAAKALLADPFLKAEQVGFALPPRKEGDLWRLEMAGGEFCGNASRSFGLLAAARCGLTGKCTLTIETSGMTMPMSVHIDTDAQSAEIEIPAPLAETEIEMAGQRLPLYEFEGIAHVIAADIQPDEQTARLIIKKLDECSRAKGRHLHKAAGVMFFDTQKCFMRPVVWTRMMDTLVCESSCGSGSAALGVWAARNTPDAELDIDLAQPGGTITVRVAKHGGKIGRLSIAGKVTLGKPLRFGC